MNKTVKATIVGGASVTWMAVFLKDICASAAMEGGTLVLQDLNEKGLETMKRFAEKLFAERGRNIQIQIETDIRRAVTGADFVINTVLVGSHDTWKNEQNLILSYGIQHPKGMSVGPGGMIMGIKQIPFVVGLARLMEEVCPQAWLLNFSNPMQLLMLATQRYSKIKSVGLCHGVRGTLEIIAERLGVPLQELSVVAGGVNHFEIIKSLARNGEDMLPGYMKRLEEIEAEKGYCGERIPRDMYKLFGGYPTNHDIHVIEFLPYYIHKGGDVTEYRQEQNYIENRIRDRAARWEQFEAYIRGEAPFDSVQNLAVSEFLGEIIDASVKNEPYMLYANVMNAGYITNLPRDICVGVPVLLSRDGYLGTCIGDLPRGLAEFSALHGAIQNFMVEGAMAGSRDMLLSGLSLDPMCYTLPLEERRKLINELIEMDREFLPNFFQ